MEKIKNFLVKFSISFLWAIYFLETVKRLMLKAERYMFYKILGVLGVVMVCVMTIALVLQDKENSREKIKLSDALYNFSNDLIISSLLWGIILSLFVFSKKEELIMCVSFLGDFNTLMIISILIYVFILNSEKKYFNL